MGKRRGESYDELDGATLQRAQDDDVDILLWVKREKKSNGGVLSRSDFERVEYPVVDALVDKGKTALDELQDEFPLVGFRFAGLEHPDEKLAPLIYKESTLPNAHPLAHTSEPQARTAPNPAPESQEYGTHRRGDSGTTG